MRQNLRPVQLAAERADASQLGTSVGTARGLRRTVLDRSESLAAARHATVTHPWFYTAVRLPWHRETATHQTTSSARRRVRFLRVFEPNHPRATEGGRPQPGHHAIFRVHPVASHRPSQSSA